MKQLIDDWDKVLEQWKIDCNGIYNNRASAQPAVAPINLSSFSKQIEINSDKAKDTDLLYYEIPEPYSCQYDNNGNIDCNAVLINLNPGTTSANEHLKYYFNAGIPKMTLINYFLNCKYSVWQQHFNYLKPDQTGLGLLKNDGLKESDIPGYDWWQNSNRIPYIKRLLSNQSPKPFIIEMCPFHSKKWGINTLSPVFDTQLTMAYEAVCISQGLKYAVGIGKAISIFLRRRYGKPKISINQTTPLDNDFKIDVSKWPEKNQKKVRRTFEIYKIDIRKSRSPKLPISTDSDYIVVLVTYAPGGNYAPSAIFKDIETELVKYLN